MTGGGSYGVFRFLHREQSRIKINCERTKASVVLLLEERNRGDDWAVERRLKGGGPAMESSENQELGRT